jgi:hypothetical protein
MQSSGMTPCDSCKNRRFGGKHRIHHQDGKNRRTRNNVSSNYQQKHAATKYVLRSVLRLVVATNIVPSSPIPVTLMMERYVPPIHRFLQKQHGVIPKDHILNTSLSAGGCFVCGHDIGGTANVNAHSVTRNWQTKRQNVSPASPTGLQGDVCCVRFSRPVYSLMRKVWACYMSLTYTISLLV